MVKSVVIQTGNALLGIDLLRVRSIVMLQSITRLPHLPHGIEGVLFLRGRTVPVVDVKARFGMSGDSEVIPKTDRERIVIVETDGAAAGLLVDSVSDITDIALFPTNSDVELDPAMSLLLKLGCVRSIVPAHTGAAGSVYVLDIKQLLDACCDGGLTALRAVQARAVRLSQSAYFARTRRAA